MGRVAVVTRGAGGFGTAIVDRLRTDGLEVVPGDLPELDVTEPQSVDGFVAEVLRTHRSIDVLVNTAGVAGPVAPVAAYPLDSWRQVLDVNLTGTFLCLQRCLPPMLERGYGRIVNIASIAGKEGNADMSAYSAAKAGVIALTKSAGKELATSGILVNCVVPAVFEVGLTTRQRRCETLSCPGYRWGEWGGPKSWLSSSHGSRPSAARSAPAPRSTSREAERSTDRARRALDPLARRPERKPPVPVAEKLLEAADICDDTLRNDRSERPVGIAIVTTSL